jgi:hypothetical protein
MTFTHLAILIACAVVYFWDSWQSACNDVPENCFIALNKNIGKIGKFVK